MKMKKLVITGSTGMLGSNLAMAARDKFEVYGLDLEVLNQGIKNQVKVDLVDAAQVDKVIKDIAPDYIVHCAAMTNVDACEKETSQARTVNAAATENLVKAAGPGVKFIYISTASVFDGETGGYTENDSPSPVNHYARTKLEGERFVEMCADHVIIRTDIIGWNLVRGRSFVEWIFSSLSQGEKIKMFTDVIFTPITVNTLSECILELLENSFTGRINMGVAGAISKYDFGIKFADIFGLDRSLISASTLAACSLTARRPKNTSLNVALAQRTFKKAWTINEELLKLKMMKGFKV